MFEDVIGFIIERYILLITLLPALLILKVRLYRNLSNGTEKIDHFFYYTYANIATTHQYERKKKKRLQNAYSFIALAIVFLHFIISIPYFLNK